LYSSPNITRMTKSKRMRWAGHVVRMGWRGMHIGYWSHCRRLTSSPISRLNRGLLTDWKHWHVFVAVYKSLQRLCSDTDITELLDFRNKSILAGDL
jgi:hypothetical protein